MKVLKERPPFECRCEYCNSVLLVEEPDLSARVDFLLGTANISAPDYHAQWTCAVCGKTSGDWLYKFPLEWRDTILKRCGLET